jgi:hypothetical protein
MYAIRVRITQPGAPADSSPAPVSASAPTVAAVLPLKLKRIFENLQIVWSKNENTKHTSKGIRTAE